MSSEELPVSNHNLRELRQQIKNAMIPLLLRTFELKLAAQQAKTPPSRLQRKREESPEKICEELLQLAADLKVLLLWCQNCQKQIDKVLKEVQEPQEPSALHNACLDTSSSSLSQTFRSAFPTQ